MEKLKQLPVHWQLLLLLGVAALVYYGFYSFVTSSMYAEAATVKEQSDALQRKNEQARIATQRIDELRQLYAAKSVEYDDLKVLLPEQREITVVLQGLQDTARASNLTLLRFAPRDDAPYTSAATAAAKSATTAPPVAAPVAPAAAKPATAGAPAVAQTAANFITAKPVEIEVSSNFSNLKAFYEKMARLQRIVSVTDIGINQLPKPERDKTINARFTLTAYYATPETPLAAATTPASPAAAAVR